MITIYTLPFGDILSKKILIILFLSISLLVASERVFIRNFKSVTIDSVQCLGLTNFFASELKSVVNWEIVTAEDVNAMLMQELDKELLNCSDVSCMHEIAGALGAPYIISADITKLGSYYILNISLLDIMAGTSKRKVSDKAKSIDEIIEMLTPLAKKIAGVTVSENRRAASKNDNQALSTNDSQSHTIVGNPVKYGMKMIPEGSFVRGSKEGGYDEIPLQQITVGAFWMDSTEVTQGEYFRLMVGTIESQRDLVDPQLPILGDSNLHPVYYVSWWDAIKYCNARSREVGLTPLYDASTGAVNLSSKGFRLPTEAEWEYATRAGTISKYYWGNSPKQTCGNGSEIQGWPNDGTSKTTSQVASYEPNKFGLYDLAGNLWEWCHDWYSSDYYAHSPSSNPLGSNKGTYRVLRGGGWAAEPASLRSANRYRGAPNNRQNSFGFRVVLAE